MKTILLLMLLATNVCADVPAEQTNEVEHLIEFIRHTDCRLERNNEFFSGEKALEHILKKYDYYRDEINSTEDFINYSASKSVISGKPYLSHCAGQQPVHGQEWLLNELKRYREFVKSR